MKRRTLALLLAAAAFATAKVAIGRRLDAQRVLAPYDIAYVPRTSAVRWASLGHPTLAANLYWLRAVQYMGEPRAGARGWDKLFPVLDLVTDLDPHHGYAYQVGANILAGAGRVDESNRLLEKGTTNVPERYILPYHRGVNAFLYEGDYAAAASWFERAAKASGAPLHTREAVMAMYVKADQADAAIRFLTHMIEASEDPESRKALEAQLQQARLEQVALRLDAAVQAFRERFVRLPFAIEEVRFAGLIDAVPPDPYGGSWILDEEGRTHSSVHDRRVMKPLTPSERRDSLQRLRSTLKGAMPR
ncbi:lipopolysaccharide assembly protein LapB [Anaeromyxobacter sp. SG17]|uniref:tetratricopeptide repeat protein n=1 Tax=Anaeromyxobacter sp. SG17 TaxID=2925405 RepID=UPI001F5AD451|nr:tetratricopeptide repeat protein [Anaeromyxobacter sp. SG17]